MLQEEIRAKEPQPAQVMRVLQAFDAFLALDAHYLEDAASMCVSFDM
jgi:hypothetical protein